MTPEERYKITSNDYVELLITYNGNPATLDIYKNYSVHIMNEAYAIIYLPTAQLTKRSIYEFGFSAIPDCYSLSGEESLEATGVNKLRRIPALNLRGEGVLVGIIDTGIDYTNPVFQHKDGTSKVAAIWDQTIESADQLPNAIYQPFYGTEYTKEQINQALKSENPFQIVPSKDEIGHGTMLAGIAAGSEDSANNFIGMAPDAELVIVKLKQTKPALRDYFSIPLDVPCFTETDIMWSIQYMVDVSRRLRRPIAICIGLSSSQGSHDGRGALSSLASIAGDFQGITISVAAGNEGNLRRHYYSTIDPAIGFTTVELNVGENEAGFSMEVWGAAPNIYTIDILSPSGEYIPKLAESLQENREIAFFFENTIINIDYIMVEAETGNQVILLRFKNPTSGIWKFQVYARDELQGTCHIWLPSNGFISNNTFFIQSNINTTITSPGNSLVPITVTAYNAITESLYQYAGRGYTASNAIKPELAAPGVNILCPSLNHGFTEMTGTSAAAAINTGAVAILLEWCIVDGNYPGIDTVGVKKFLIRGAKRSESIRYPNRDWGYGILDIYNVFDVIRSDISG